MSTGLGRWERVILEFAAVQTTSQSDADITRRLRRWIEHCRSVNIDPTRRDERAVREWASELDHMTAPGTPISGSTPGKFETILRAWFAWWEDA